MELYLLSNDKDYRKMVEEFISSDDKYQLESSQEKKTTLINKLLNEHEYDKITKEIDDVLNNTIRRLRLVMRLRPLRRL